MRYYKKTVLKNGQECVLRHASSQDAELLLEHLKISSGETKFLSRYPDEINTTVSQEAQYLAKVEEDAGSLLILAETGGELAGYAGLSPIGVMDKYRHRAEIGLSVKKSFWRQGIGSELLSSIVEAAYNAGYLQLELEVMADNAAAVSLYEKHGFLLYGVRYHAFRHRDGTFSTSCLMLLTLDETS